MAENKSFIEVNDVYMMISKRDGKHLKHHWKSNEEVLLIINKLIEVYWRGR
tara:strand:- start:969 stop:1121 length:153 start_codon:yes stop_codon:yes gene_type:complete